MASSELKSRLAYLNDSDKNTAASHKYSYTGNGVSTAKYTVASFIPKTIFEFFRVVANRYFLVIALLQVLTRLSPTNRFTTAGPLVIVLFVTMIKQGIEDSRRHAADKKQNSRISDVLGGDGNLVKKKWEEVAVGDILRIGENDEVPADIIVLATSEEEGRAYIETANLDGETNLKRRTAVEATAKLAGLRKLNQDLLDEKQHMKSTIALKGVMEYELPNNQLYNFTGALSLENDDKKIPIGPSNIILRGCNLRSCAYVYGFVIFTGPETKLMQNARAAPSKQSNVYIMVNRCINLIFFTQFLLCVISTICNALWAKENLTAMWYLDSQQSQGWDDSFQHFFTFLILYNNLVPISLYVSLDMIKVIQAKRIAADESMNHEGFYAIARTSELNEELGQVQYIFSDKTGTLTRNIMEFRKCSIGQKSYGYGTTEIGRAAALANNTLIAEDMDKSDPIAAQVDYDPSIQFDDPGLLKDLESGENSKLIHEFLTILAVCHTVVPEVNHKTGAINFRASSPDEEALVKAAMCLGYKFTTPAPEIKLQIKHKSGKMQEKLYRVLNINEFSSARKRMSVVVLTEEGEYVLYCKGADSAMLPYTVDAASHTLMIKNIERFADEGLRTLVLGKRVLTKEEFDAWDAEYCKAASALENRDDLMEAVAEEIEKKLSIVGATAIEDKLQVGVPAAIENLAKALVKLWVLTGDKMETAINIGYACRLLNKDMNIITISTNSKEELVQRIDEIYGSPDIKALIDSKATSELLALVIDGQSLVHVFHGPMKKKESNNDDLATKLLQIASCCTSVIACRVSPAQKADIVSLVRTRSPGSPITLAIGDGANDVNMIQTAHVGIGICGQEGVQAMNNSDYAIAQFRFLVPLMLIHGRYNYKRLSKVILYSFYKNISLVVTLFLYNFFNGQSGASLFESFVMAGWNFFLALPIIAIGVFDEDVSVNTVMNWPRLYSSGQANADLNVKSFTTWILLAFLHGIICFSLPFLLMHKVWDENGSAYGHTFFGTVLYSGLLMTMNFKVALITLVWTSANIRSFTFSIFLFFFFLLTYPNMTFVSWEMFGVAMEILSSELFWFSFVFVPVCGILSDFLYAYIKSTYYPRPEDILRELPLRPTDIVSPSDLTVDKPSVNISSSTPRVGSIKGRRASEYHGFAFNSPGDSRARGEDVGHTLASAKVLDSRRYNSSEDLAEATATMNRRQSA